LSLLLIDLVGGVEGDILRERDSSLLRRRKCVLPDEYEDDMDTIVLGWRRCDDGSTNAASTDIAIGMSSHDDTSL
jgi:hypothetical protein